MHSIMCFHSVRSACWQSHQCNQCLCVLRPYQKPQFKVCSTCRPSPSCAFSFCTSEQCLCVPDSITVHSTHLPVLVDSMVCITIAASACAFQSVQSTHRQSTAAISACVSNIRVSNHSSLCVPTATIRTCAFYFHTSERKSFMQSTQSPT